MSRWADTFAALSGAPDTSDTSDKRSARERGEAASVATVNSVKPDKEPTTAGPEAAERLTSAVPDGPCVTCVASVKGAGTQPAIPASEPSLIAHDRSSTLATQAERAAIVEIEAGAPRSWAVGFARLDPERPPADVPQLRWLRFIEDCGRFIDGGFAQQAAALGWGPLDLFGCDGDRPFARIDKAGLLWLVNGRRLVALTGDAAVIETGTGARQTYRRKQNEPDRVLAWEIVS